MQTECVILPDPLLVCNNNSSEFYIAWTEVDLALQKFNLKF